MIPNLSLSRRPRLIDQNIALVGGDGVPVDGGAEPAVWQDRREEGEGEGAGGQHSSLILSFVVCLFSFV